MRTNVVRIKAKDAQPGMILCFSNPRYDQVIDEVTWCRDGEVKIETGNFTGSSWWKQDDIIWVKKL